MPRLLLHIGMPKTGTSALQAVLSAGHDDLARSGVLYPKTPDGTHNFLVAGFSRYPPRTIRHRYRHDPAALEHDFAVWWDNIKTQIADRKPDLVVMSGEAMFRPLGRFKGKPKALLTQISKDILVAAYVRRPSSYYLSHAQQKLKGSHQLEPPRAIRYRPILAAYQADFPLQVVPYQRESLKDGDIVADFLTRFLPGIAIAPPSADAGELNETLAAEAMSILQEYRETFMRDANNRFTRQSDRLLRVLQKAAAKLELRKPELFPHLRDYIDQSSEDLTWLQDEFGIRFAGIDYARVGSADPSCRMGRRPRVDEICAVDAGNRQKLLMQIVKEYTGS